MDLALHVGTLTDYFHAAVCRQAAADDDGTGPMPGREDVEQRILEWRSYISEGLVRNGHLQSALDWPEVQQPTWTFGMPADALRALKLLLVHDDEHPPPAELPEAPDRHPVWIAASQADFEDHPQPNVLVPEFWLPGDHDFTFPCPYPDGHEVQTGWTERLLAECRQIADGLLVGGSAAAQGLAAGPPPRREDGLRPLAAFAVAGLLLAAERAVSHRLPVLIHT